MPRSLLPRRALLAGAVLTVTVASFATPAGATNDLRWSQQWGPQKVNAPAAWTVSTGSGIKIGIVDTGIDLGHEDLAGRIVASTTCIGTEGDVGRCSGNGQDDAGHGTHVAGTAAAAKENGKGIAGIAPNAQLVVAKVLDSDGGGYIDDVDAGIRWVVDHGAQVVNLSLGGDGGGLLGGLLGGSGDGESSMKASVEYAWSKGAIPVIAAGNGNQDLFGGSANYGQLNAIVVGATTKTDGMAGYSSPIGNAKWGIVAPGGAGSGAPNEENIISSYWIAGQSNQYAWSAGTSMATPHVSGAVALLLAKGLGRDAAIARILDTANPSVSCGSTCRGRLDVAAAVGADPNAGSTTTAPPTTAKPTPTTKPASKPRTTAAPTTAAPTTAVPVTEAPSSTTTTTEPEAEPSALADDDPVIALPTSNIGRDEPEGTAETGAVALVAQLAVLASAFRLYRRRKTVTTLP